MHGQSHSVWNDIVLSRVVAPSQEVQGGDAAMPGGRQQIWHLREVASVGILGSLRHLSKQWECGWWPSVERDMR